MPGVSYRRRLRYSVVLVLRISSANYLPCVLILKGGGGGGGLNHFKFDTVICRFPSERQA